MANIEQRRQLFTTVELKHGSIGFLGRVLLKAEYACQERGVSLEFVTAKDLQLANHSNAATWSPLLPLFDHRYNDLSDENFFAIVGRDSSGDIVACQGARHFDWHATNYFDECASLRLFYGCDTSQKLPDEECRVSAIVTKAVTGSVVFSGAAWYRPDYRGVGLVELLPRIARALAYTKWNTDFTVTMMVEANVRKGVFPRNGYPNIEWDIDVIGSRAGTARAAFMWIKQAEMLADLQVFLSDFDAEISRRGNARRASQ
jgi:hypothetical protein